MKNTFVKVLSLLMALMMAVGAFSMVTVTAAGCDHTKGELVEEKSKAPTCVAWGYSTYICGICGEEWETDAVAPSPANHNYVEKKEVYADCFTNYISAGKSCEYCGKVLEGCVEAAGTRLDHQFVGTIIDATCTEPAKLVYTCKLCSYDAETIKVKGWYMGGADWLDKYETNWKANNNYSPALNANHANLEWTMVVSPSCTPGKAEGFCKSCNQVVRETEIPAIHGGEANKYEVNPYNHACAEYPSGVWACKTCHTILTPNAQKNEHAGEHKVTTSIWEFNGYTAQTTISATDLPSKPNGGAFTIAELKRYGYEVGQTLVTPATCTATGSQLVQCECGAIFTETIKKANHNYGGAAYTYVVPKNCTEAYYKTRTCITANCGYKDVVILAAAANASHNMVVVPSNANVPDDQKSKDPSCTEISFVFRKCSNVDCMGNACGVTAKDTYADPKGHTFGAPYFVSGSCDANPVYYKKCSVCNTEVPASASELTAAQKAHVWGAEVTVDPTCQEAEYKYVPCTVCGAWKDNPTKTHNYTQGSQKNPAVHVYASAAELKAFVEAYDNDKNHTSDASLGIIGFNGSNTSSCTVAGQLNIKCKYCSMDIADSRKTVAAPKADHDKTTGSRVIYNSNGTFNRVDANPVAPKCNQIGYKANGEYCADCGYMMKAPEVDVFNLVGAVNKDSSTAMQAYHSGTITWFHVYEATCQRGSYAVYDTTCCGQVTVNVSGPVDHVYNTTYPYNPANCNENGNHAYIGCQWCKAYKTMFADATLTAAVACTCGKSDDEHRDLAVEDKYVIDALGHKFKTKHVAVRETCDEAGTAEYYTCNRAGCNYATFGNDEYNLDNADDMKAFELAVAIPAHYSKHVQHFDAKAATCTSPAIVAGDYCTVCEKDDWFTGVAIDHTYEHFYVNCTDTFALKNCTEDAAYVKRCTVCGHYETAFFPKTNATHSYPADWTVNTPAATETCYVNATKTKECQVCVDKSIARIVETTAVATGHYTTKGIEAENATKYMFVYTCDKINEFKDYNCYVCGQSYLALLDAILAKENGEDLVHNKINLYKDSTCTEVGYEITSCKNGCNYKGALEKYNFVGTNRTIETKNNTGKHTLDNNSVILERVEATTENGYVKYLCSVCKEEDTIILYPAQTITVTTDAASVTAGDSVVVTVKFDKVSVKFNVLELVLDTDDMFTADDVNSVATGFGTDVEIIAKGNKVQIYPSDTSKTVSLNANSNASVTFTLNALQSANGDVKVDVTSVVAYTVKNDGSVKTNDVTIDAAAADVKVNMLGNVNGDYFVTATEKNPVINAADYKEVYLYAQQVKIGEAEYAVKYDINRDGVVDVNDAMAVKAFALSDKTAEDYMTMLGYEFDKLDASVAGLDFTKLVGKDLAALCQFVED